MNIADIQEGKSYRTEGGGTYFRTVEFIVDAPKRPGGKWLNWHTDGFCVQDQAHKRHGKCSIATFAKWAKEEVCRTNVS